MGSQQDRHARHHGRYRTAPRPRRRCWAPCCSWAATARPPAGWRWPGCAPRTSTPPPTGMCSRPSPASSTPATPPTPAWWSTSCAATAWPRRPAMSPPWWCRWWPRRRPRQGRPGGCRPSPSWPISAGSRPPPWSWPTPPRPATRAAGCGPEKTLERLAQQGARGRRPGSQPPATGEAVLAELLEDFAHPDTAVALPTGIASLDRMLAGGGWRPGLFLLAAGPGVGKSAFALQSCLRAVGAGHVVLYVSIEQSPKELVGRIFCRELQAPIASYWNRDPDLAAGHARTGRADRPGPPAHPRRPLRGRRGPRGHGGPDPPLDRRAVPHLGQRRWWWSTTYNACAPPRATAA